MRTNIHDERVCFPFSTSRLSFLSRVGNQSGVPTVSVPEPTEISWYQLVLVLIGCKLNREPVVSVDLNSNVGSGSVQDDEIRLWILQNVAGSTRLWTKTN